MSTRHKKRYRPRPVAINTLELASSRAAKPAAVDIADILIGMTRACQAMRTGQASQLHWSILAGAIEFAQAIERKGIVKGLETYLSKTADMLNGIHDRAVTAHGWLPPTLYAWELEALQTFADLHTYQIKQLSRAELMAAVRSAQGRVRQSGGSVTLAKNMAEVTA